MGVGDTREAIETRTKEAVAETVADFVATPSTKPYTVIAVARLVTGGFTCENVARYQPVTLSAFGMDTTTNQEAAGSNPAGRANLYKGFLLFLLNRPRCRAELSVPRSAGGLGVV